ncbi:cell wall metabolism sensor histidine kinase WalK [Paenibacillus mesophilus]|uniref:cell wall metabolism sensor histidine kinase WalK n=1 Tax=Paenibacillus mesophilus TaxID=2582849 RepID=UPI00110E30C0|nr:cell wall metabolism sensor histidine kinase WalK [Paenibacillus mesophilus]TMV47997.1 cell wall metabolism sensor histidine kinase WalK [Paenibacillus mesophilus]
MKEMRLFQTIQSKIIIIYVLLILMAMQLIGVYFVRTMERSFIDNFTDSLNKQAYLLANFSEPYLIASQDAGPSVEGKKSYADLNEIVNNLFNISDAEIQIIDANGLVLTTSVQSKASLIGQKNTQAEVVSALQGIKDIQSETIDSDGHRRKVVAQPVSEGAKVLGAVYIVASMESLYGTMNRINKIFLSGTGIALALTVFLGVIISHTITNPIKEITRQASAMADGNFNQQVSVKGPDEIGQLGNAFNHMTNRLKEALSLNEEEREKLASVLANMNDGVIATDDQGTIIVVNRQAKQMLRIGNEDITDRNVSEVLGIGEEKIGQYVQGEHQTATIQIANEEEGDFVTLRVVFTPIHRRGEGITGTIAMLHDITEQEQLENARREFVANVSHELRTPLTTMKSYLEALDDGAIEDPTLAHRFVGVMRNETERMIRLVNDLLHLSRLDSRKALISRVPTYVPDMLEEVADRFSFQLDQKEISIEIAVDPGIQDVLLDRDQIDQVLDNLVSNAIKYTPEGGAIAIRAGKTEKEWLEIAVQDNGIGIPRKDLARIFDRFYRVDKARSRNMGGTGLGLSIAREIVKAHGGTISLDSELNQGTRVTFALPVHRTEGEAV